MQNNKHGIRMFLLLSALAIMILAQPAISQSTTSSTSQSSLINGFCGGVSGGTGSITSGSGGVIPTSNILSGQTAGEQGILTLSILIMLVMLIVVALIYMVSYIMNLDLLRNIVKAEIGEIFITAIIVFVFVGSFSILGAATSATTAQPTGFALAGNSFGRSVFVDDCTYLSTASVALVVPFFTINIVRFIVVTISMTTFSLTPTYFGFQVSPFAGYRFIDTVLGYLDTIAGALILLVLGTLVILGIIYAIFPIFLYAGIVLRTLPWTRAAGGAFLGLFAGFYIVFPLLLHFMLGGYIASIAIASTSSTAGSTSSSTVLSQLTSSLSSQPPTTAGISSIASTAYSLISAIISAGATAWTNGVIGGFITYVLEPAGLVIFAIIVAFIISFDFAEAMGDILGAPSLRASNIFNKVL